MKIHTLLLIAVIAVTGAFLTACGGAATSSSSAPANNAVPASSAAAPSGLPCNPGSGSCWLPSVASSPQEQFISYRPAKTYASVYPLASALNCAVMPADGNYTPSAQGVNCESGLAQGVVMYPSPSAETAAASTDLSFAQNTGDIFGLFGPGWVVGVGDTDTYAAAIQAQSVVGGEVVCFSDGVTVDGIAPCSHSAASASAAPSSSAPISQTGTCPNAPAGYDASQRLVFNGACATWYGQVQQQISENGGDPGQAANSWCKIYDGDSSGTDSLAQLLPACRAGIAAAGGPAVSES